MDRISRLGCVACASLVAICAVSPREAEARGRGWGAAGVVGGLIVGGIIANELSKPQRSQPQPRPESRQRREARPSQSESSGNSSSSSSSEDSDDVSSVQRGLKELGFYSGAVDGQPGPQYRQAVSDFQRAIGVNVTGKLQPSQRDELMRQATLAATRNQTQQQAVVQPPQQQQVVIPPQQQAAIPPQQPQAPQQVVPPPQQQASVTPPPQPQYTPPPVQPQTQSANIPSSSQIPPPSRTTPERTKPGTHVEMLAQLQRISEEPNTTTSYFSGVDISPSGEVRISFSSVVTAAEPTIVKSETLEVVGTSQNLMSTIDRDNDHVVHVVFHDTAQQRQLILYSVSLPSSREARDWAQNLQTDVDQLSVLSGKSEDPFSNLKVNRRRPQA